MQTTKRTMMALTLTLVAPAAGAHTFGADSAGFGAGLVHPLIGLDHLLALLGAGLWASWLGGRARVVLPAGFLAGLLGGALLAWGGVGLPLVEPMIAVSLLVFGLAAASALRPSTLAGMFVVSGFALFHGYAHGVELPQAGAPAFYLLGILLASALVQAVAIRTADGLRQGRAAVLQRVAGAGLAASGVGWLFT